MDRRAKPVDQFGPNAAFRDHTVEPNLLDEKQSATGSPPSDSPTSLSGTA